MDAIKSRTMLILLALLFTSQLAVLYVQFPALTNPYVIDDDLRQLFWMWRFQDHEVFANDFIFENVKRVHIVHILGMDFIVQYESIGFSLLYQLASYVISPLAFNKVLPFLLMAACVVYLFLFGLMLQDEWTGVFLALLCIVYNLSAFANISVTTGLQRAFQFPLFISFLYYLLRRSSAGLVVCLVFQAIFYFPIFVVATATYVISLFYRNKGRIEVDLSAKRLTPLMIGVLLSALLFVPVWTDANLVAGPELGYVDENVPLWKDPAYGPSGRAPIFTGRFFWIFGYGGLARHGDMFHMIPLVLGVLLVFPALGFESFCLKWEGNALLLGSLAGWLTAWASALVTNRFVLHDPSKYTQAPVPLWLLLYLSLNADLFLRVIVSAWRGRLGRTAVLISVIALLILSMANFYIVEQIVRPITMGLGAIGLIVGVGLLLKWRIDNASTIFSLLSGNTKWRAWGGLLLIACVIFVPKMKSHAMSLDQEQMDLITYVARLPKDILLAGSPAEMSNIPLFAKRSVLFSDEISYVGGTKVLDFFNAYYAESSDQVLAFCQRYDVDYLVVDERHFSPDHLTREQFFYSPFNESIVQSVATRSNFILPQILDSHRAFQSGPLFVVACTIDALQ